MRKHALIAALAVMVTLSGCSAITGGNGGGSGTPSVSEIQSQTQQAMQDVSTYAFGLNMDMSAQGRTISMSADGVVDHENRRMRMQVNAFGQQVTQYVIDDTMYQNVGGRWQTQDVSDQNMWEQGTTLQQQRQILENADVTLQGTQTVDGTETYVVRINPNETELRQLLQQQGTQGALAQGVSFSDVQFTQYIGTQDYLPRRVEINMTVSSQGQEVEVDMAMTFSDFGRDVSIQLPSEAQNAGAAERAPVARP
ncbi:MAG: DUF6612 family protein [Haloarculaceae archaeon]